MSCRFCGYSDLDLIIDLGFQPPSNSYLESSHQTSRQLFFPLRMLSCPSCNLVQAEDYADPEELFTHQYPYLSSTSSTWLKHAEKYCRMIVKKLGLNHDSFVIEVASNDGYLLKNFVKMNVPCLGIEPTKSTASVALGQGIKTVQEFFTEALAKQLVEKNLQCDLIVGNNVYAHVPDINDFTSGIAAILKPEGVVTLEFPHFLNLIKKAQFDTIYHEHFSYLTLKVVSKIFAKHNLKIFDVEQLETHGGSLRIYGARSGSRWLEKPSVRQILKFEEEADLFNFDTFKMFNLNVQKIKYDLLSFLIEQKRGGKRIVGYGAAAKGNTFINYAGIKSDLLSFVVDSAKSKQNKWLPGSNIPIFDPQILNITNVDFVWILPWNLADEITDQLTYLKSKGIRFFTAIPSLELLN